MNSEWLWERLQILEVPIAFVLTPEPRNESVLILGPTGQDLYQCIFFFFYQKLSCVSKRTAKHIR